MTEERTFSIGASDDAADAERPSGPGAEDWLGRGDRAWEGRRLAEALEAYGKAYVQCAAVGADRDAFRAGVGAARAGARLGRWSVAVERALEAREAAERVGDIGLRARAEEILGAIEVDRGHWHEACRRFGVARELAGAHGHRDLLHAIESRDGALWTALGERDRAEEAFRGVMLRFEAGDEDIDPGTLQRLGVFLAASGRFAEAETAYERALAASKRSLDLPLGVRIMVQRGRLALARGDLLKAHALAMTAHSLAEWLGEGPYLPEVARLRASVARTLGHAAEAEQRFREAIELAAGGRAPLVEAEAWSELGEVWASQGRWPEARTAWAKAGARFGDLGALREVERLRRRRESAEDPGAGTPVGEPIER